MLNLMQQIVILVKQAGQATLPFWQNSVTVQQKQDNSPVTEADLTANQLLISALQQLTPHIPILSEEACQIDLATRQQWQTWWLIDPLDGTKEFIDGREDFTVNVALIEQGKVVFGVVGTPVTDTCYYGGKNLGAWQQDTHGNERPLHCRKADPNHLLVVASHRHNSAKQQQLIAGLQQIAPLSLQNIGSSLKFCLIAEGKADCYPRFAPTCQWDTAAAQGVLEGAGGRVLTEQGQILHYLPKTEYLNPYFIALGDSDYWQPTLLKLVSSLSN